MGLDMYLEAEKYFWSYPESKGNELVQKLEDRDKNAILAIYFPVHEDTASLRMSANVMYWRKANHIHHWFVEKVQEGNDDCGRYYVSREQLEELKRLCVKIAKIVSWNAHEEITEAMKEEIESLMPPVEGFFFGNSDINIWYLENTINTVRKLDQVLEAYGDGYTFYYQSSW